MAVESLWCLVSATCCLKGGVLDDHILSELVEQVPSHPHHPAGRCAII